jgi:hypothetical protein
MEYRIDKCNSTGDVRASVASEGSRFDACQVITEAYMTDDDFNISDLLPGQSIVITRVS